MDTQTIKPDGELLEARKALKDHTRRARQDVARQKNLSARRAELTGNLPNLEKGVDQCRKRKDQVFELELTGQAGDGEIEQIKKALALAESELLDSKEKIAALDRISKRESDGLQKLQAEEVVLTTKFWNALYKNLKSEILGEVGELVKKAHCAKILSGGGRLPVTLMDTFGPERIEENAEICDALQKEHFGEN